MPVYKVFFAGVITADDDVEATELAKANKSRLIHQKTMLLQGIKQEDVKGKESDHLTNLEQDLPFILEEIFLQDTKIDFVYNINFNTAKIVYLDRNDGSMIVQCDLNKKNDKKTALIYVPPEQYGKREKSEIVECIPALANFAVQKFLQIGMMKK